VTKNKLEKVSLKTTDFSILYSWLVMKWQLDFFLIPGVAQPVSRPLNS
jgi:hypothetical protein